MNTWDKYFFHHGSYKPKGNNWGSIDLENSYHWFLNWVSHFEAVIPDFTLKDKEVLEIGCGIGGLCKVLHSKGARVTGSDVTNSLLTFTKSLQQDIKFCFLDIRKKQKIKKKYDYIFSIEVLEHLAHPQIPIKNIHSLLKKDGVFIGSSPYPFPKNLLDTTHKSVLYPENWKQLFLNAGFSRVYTNPLSFAPLLWRLNPYLNIPIPWYIRNSKFVSTTLIIAHA